MMPIIVHSAWQHKPPDRRRDVQRDHHGEEVHATKTGNTLYPLVNQKTQEQRQHGLQGIGNEAEDHRYTKGLPEGRISE